MSEAVVAKRYADALFQLANEKDIVEKLISELQIVKEVFTDGDEIVNFLTHPRVTNDQKVKLIDESFKACDRNVVNTLKLLVERNRINVVTLIVDHFTELHNEANGIAAATVYSVRELSANEQTEIQTSLKKQFNKDTVSISNIVDPSLLGGLKIRVGNTIYDGSVSGKLNRIKNQLVSESI